MVDSSLFWRCSVCTQTESQLERNLNLLFPNAKRLKNENERYISISDETGVFVEEL